MELGLNLQSAAEGAVKDVTTASFETDVIRASMERPVVVDFWATWCGPCKQLAPALEKAVAAQRGKVSLAKVDVDKNPDLAQALRIQSIPTVYAFYQGRPVDAFQGALPESQVRQWVEKLSQMATPGEDDPLVAALEQAQAMVDAGDLDNAVDLYRAIIGEVPDNAPAYAGLIRTLVASGALDQARAAADQIPAAIANNADVAAARSALDLAEQAANAGPLGPLSDAVERDPGDLGARYELAMALYAAGRQAEAIDHLIESVRRDRAWNEEQARKQLVKFFEALGPMDPISVAGRRKLSSILFS